MSLPHLLLVDDSEAILAFERARSLAPESEGSGLTVRLARAYHFLGDADTALRLARRYYAEPAAEGDPRYLGYAQAALGPWWRSRSTRASCR